MKHNLAYISDATTGFGGPDNAAIVIVDLETEISRSVLRGESRLQEDPSVPFEVEGVPIADGLSPRHINGITIDPNNENVYFSSLQGDVLYRLKAKYLADESLSDDELADKIVRAGDKPNSDGILVDRAGNVYQSDFGDNAVGVTMNSGEYRVLHKDDDLVWPNAFSFGPDGYIYVTASQVHLSPGANMGPNLSVPPYFIMRFKSLVPNAASQ